MNSKTIIWWVLRVLLGLALIVFSFPKLSGDISSIELFNKVGGGDPLRYLTGIMELAAGILLLIPMTTLIGAGLTLAAMAGAIVSHLAILGFDFPFPLAVIFAVIAAGIVWLTRGRTGVALVDRLP
jgi:putative oxidoreductase